MVSTPEYHQHVSGLKHRVAVRNDFFVSAEDEQYKTFGVEFADAASVELTTEPNRKLSTHPHRRAKWQSPTVCRIRRRTL